MRRDYQDQVEKEQIGDVYSHQVWDSDFRLVGGVVEKRRPWNALIITYSGPELRREEGCGGTLINHWWGSKSVFYSIVWPGMCLQQPTASVKQKKRVERKRAGAKEPAISSKWTASNIFTTLVSTGSFLLIPPQIILIVNR